MRAKPTQCQKPGNSLLEAKQRQASSVELPRKDPRRHGTLKVKAPTCLKVDQGRNEVVKCDQTPKKHEVSFILK